MYILLIPDVVFGAGEAMRRREFITLLGSANALIEMKLGALFLGLLVAFTLVCAPRVDVVRDDKSAAPRLA